MTGSSGVASRPTSRQAPAARKVVPKTSDRGLPIPAILIRSVTSAADSKDEQRAPEESRKRNQAGSSATGKTSIVMPGALVHLQTYRPILALLAVILALASGPLAVAQRPNAITFEEGEEGWMLLFYGNSLDDWTPSGDAEWREEDGAIVSDSGGRGLLLGACRGLVGFSLSHRSCRRPG